MLARLVFMNFFNNKGQIYGISLFYVQTYKKTLSMYSFFTDNIWIGIRFDKIVLLKPDKD